LTINPNTARLEVDLALNQSNNSIDPVVRKLDFRFRNLTEGVRREFCSIIQLLT